MAPRLRIALLVFALVVVSLAGLSAVALRTTGVPYAVRRSGEVFRAHLMTAAARIEGFFGQTLSDARQLALRSALLRHSGDLTNAEEKNRTGYFVWSDGRAWSGGGTFRVGGGLPAAG